MTQTRADEKKIPHWMQAGVKSFDNVTSYQTLIGQRVSNLRGVQMQTLGEGDDACVLHLNGYFPKQWNNLMHVGYSLHSFTCTHELAATFS